MITDHNMFMNITVMDCLMVSNRQLRLFSHRFHIHTKKGNLMQVRVLSSNVCETKADLLKWPSLIADMQLLH